MWNLRNHETYLEYIMRRALIKNDFRFADQVYTQTDVGHYIYDFVIYGKYCTIIVECDGPHHKLISQETKDAIRDLWSVTHGFQTVLRFSEEQIRNQMNDCILHIRNNIDLYDKVLMNSGKRPYPAPLQRPVHDLKRRIRRPLTVKAQSDFFDGNYEFIKPYIKKQVPIPRNYKNTIEQNISTNFPCNNPPVNQQSIIELRRKEINSLTKEYKNTPKKPKIFIDHLPAVDQEYFNVLQTLSTNDKKIMYFIISNTSKDGVSLYFGTKQSLLPLLELNLLVFNSSYRPSSKGELSLFVLPQAPYLLREIIRYAK
ncbi:endonuclease domain-containing protein [Paenibacillus montanisoli]|uniref:DUF559 domain-containing protein n=1 Tax=Paenibacillus montanisoli TaxID=2081970 RepID=A0A328U311_9BACL|nr:DUF559 domain-containing protein [Paenibacillus montanisoli]RAP74364.1 hypothetical protein DL346_19985 [Paenibacillus montanisoli]